MDWLPTFMSSIVAVAASAAFTWLFNFGAERHRRQGVRALVAQELLQNKTTVHVLIGELKQMQGQSTVRAVIHALKRRRQPIPWQQARWLLSDVGVAFSPVELTQLTEWYVKLDHLTYLQGSLVDSAETINEKFTSDRAIPEDIAAMLMEQLKATIDFAEDMLAHGPELPDTRLNRDRGVKKYVQKLVRRALSQGIAVDEITSGSNSNIQDR